MGINKNYYVIAGYDLTTVATDKYSEWKWTDEGEAFWCHQSVGNIQLFDDPMSGSYLYLGKVLAAGDEYYFGTTKFDVADIKGAFDDVTFQLCQLRHAGIISQDSRWLKFQIIVFEECT